LPAVEAVDAANEEVSSGETEEHAAASKVDAVE
jgi:hypothetical protein